MKRYLFACLLSVVINSMTAQTIQNGIVKEYNERLAKTPLANVEILISNAQSTISSDEGLFKLQFRTLKPGDKVNVRRIEKAGYEIFNKEALEQWYIARDGKPFIVVMCKSEKFKRIRDKYSRISSESYNKQYQRELARLTEERKAGKLKEQEYEEKLAKLSDDYDKSLEKLDGYVDRFARIDLSELSQKEAEIIEFVQKGELEKAIQLYNAENLEEKFKSQVASDKKVTEAIDVLNKVKKQIVISKDSIFSAILRKNELLRLVGGADNFKRIEKNLRTVADADTSYYPGIIAFGDFLYSQHEYEKAYEYYSKGVNLLLTDDERINLLFCLQKSVYMSGLSLDLSILYGNQRIKLLKKVMDTESMEYAVKCAESYRFLGFAQRAQKQFDNAKAYFQKAKEILLPFKAELSDDDLMLYARLVGNAGSVDLREKRYREAEKYYLESLIIIQQLREKNPQKFNSVLANHHHDLGLIYYHLDQLTKAIDHFEQSCSMYAKLSEKNPSVYEKDKIRSLIDLGIAYAKNKEKLKADEYYHKAYLLILKANEVDEQKYAKMRAEVQVYFARRYAAKQDYEKALELVDAALLVKRKLSYLELKGMLLVELDRRQEAIRIWEIHFKDKYLGKEKESKLYRMLFK